MPLSARCRRRRLAPLRRLAASLVAAALAPAPAAGSAAADAPAGAPAAPARLRLETAEGARVRFDRSSEWLPTADGAVERDVVAGRHTVRLRLRGHMDRKEGVLLEPGESRTLIAPLAPKTRLGGIVRAALVPGLGSRYMDRPATAWTLGAAALASVTAAFLFDRQMADRADTYDAEYARYLSEVDPVKVEEAWGRAEAAFAEVEDAKDRRTAALAVLGAAYAVSLAEALLAYPFGERGDEVGAAGRGAGPGAAALARLAAVAEGGAPARFALVRIPLGRPAPRAVP